MNAAADRALVERILAETGVDRVPVPPQASYLGELFRAAQQALLDAILRGGRMLSLPPRVLEGIAWGLAALAVLLIVRAVVSRLRRRGRAGTVEGDGAVAALGIPAAARDAAAWRAELERRLAEGRIAEALEALWWWLARSLAGDRVEPDWTSRDLVARARRQDLRDLVRRLDAFTYGPRQPGIDDLRSLVGRLEQALA
ncbi:MAG TPA: hypothetical protein VKK31_21180 [Thermoanaerobaculia bacterium]|nr:hypothetical protein [Thermoanaerobaculia bacterium]